MKVNVGLFTLIVCGLVSTGAAMARHHSHHGRGISADRSHVAHPAGNTAAPGDQRGNEPHSGSAGHASATRDSAPKSGGEARVDEEKGIHDRKGATNDTIIDTRITVHQGHEKTRSVRERLFGKPKGGLAAIAGRNSQRPTVSKTTLHRNAIGALITDNKHTRQDKAAVAPASPAASTVSPAAGATLPSISKVDPGPKSSIVAVEPPVTPNPGPSPPDGHTAATAAIAVISKGGQSINGTGFSRPGSSAAMLGGSPKIVAGVISGNSVHLKHP